MNEEVGTVQVCNTAKVGARYGVGDNASGACLLQTGGRDLARDEEDGACRSPGKVGPCTFSKGLLFISPFAPRKTQLSRNPRLRTWLLPSSVKYARTLSFILKEGKKVSLWCQVGVPSFTSLLVAAACPAPPAVCFWGAWCCSHGQTHFVAGSS